MANRWHPTILVVLTFLGSIAPALAEPVVRRAGGADAAAIQATVEQFRANLGGSDNGAAVGPLPPGRREITWDVVEDIFASPAFLTGSYFNAVSKRGVLLSALPTGLKVSMDDDTPPDDDPDILRFGEFNPAYGSQFKAYSAPRLFAPHRSTETDVTFQVPGTTRDATVSGFGVVFTDVDLGGSTKVSFFDELGRHLHTEDAPLAPGGLSFVGVSFNAGERVGWVRITCGTSPLSAGLNESSVVDVVAMDDFIYGEPRATTGPASFDPTFADDLIAPPPDELPLPNAGRAEAIAVEPDGKIVIAGTTPYSGIGDFALSNVFVARFEANGTPDTTFGQGGWTRFRLADGVGVNRLRALAVQPDGRIVVAGTAGGDVGVARLLTDGTFDPEFGGDGRVTTDLGNEDEAFALAIQPDGRVVVAARIGGSAIAVVRYLPLGGLDTSFNPQAGSGAFDGNGRLQMSFGSYTSVRGLALQSDGKIVLAGGVGLGTSDFLIVRLLPDGRTDSTFDDDGVATVDFGASESASAVLVAPDGRIVVGGTYSGGLGSDFAVARLLPNGSLDPSLFPSSSGLPHSGNGQIAFGIGNADLMTAMALQADGRLVLVGYTDAGPTTPQNIVIFRVTSEGQWDGTFSNVGRAIIDLAGDDAAFAVAVQPDAKILIAGRRGGEVMLARLRGGPSPGISITCPLSEVGTSTTPFMTLRGTAADDVGVAEVTWTTDRGFSGSATGQTVWSADIPLSGGANVITVTARDAAGNSASDTITVNVSEFAYYLSEGATGAFFDLDILIANPTDTPAEIAITYLKPDGTTVPQSFSLAARTRRTVTVEDVPGLESTAVSAVIRSTNAVPLAVERTMFWDGAYYGGHTGNAVDAPQTQWLFGEGSQGFFDTYLLLANSNTQTTQATVTFLVEGGPPVVRIYDVAPTSRLNVYAGSIPELQNKSFSSVVTSSLPIIAERAMYFGSRLFEGGHASAGVSQSATSWFHAEGSTGSYFDTYILVGNPNPTPADLTVTFLKGDGTSIERKKQVPANGRLTLFVDAEDPALSDTAVSTTVVSDIPVVSERAMYWAGTSNTWFEAHNSFGVTSTARKWALAEGRVGGAAEFETYVLVANPDSERAQVRATFLRANGGTIVKTYEVAPTSRFNIWVNYMVPELQNEEFGVLIEVINDVNVAVERALYWSSGGVGFAGGTNATAVRVP